VRCCAGANCEVLVDLCEPGLCGNGNCLSLVNDYRCLCDLPYTGRRCDVKMNPCEPSQCAQGALCVPEANYVDFSCHCPPGYQGRLCEHDIDECLVANPCINGATCQNMDGSYNCYCPLGFMGRNCETNHNDCDPCA
jgi:Notch-like protein